MVNSSVALHLHDMQQSLPTLACATCISKLTCGWKSTGSRPRHSNCTIVLKRSLSSVLNPEDIECSAIRETNTFNGWKRQQQVQCCTKRRTSLICEPMMLKMLTYIIRCDCVFQDICKKDKCCTSTTYFYLTRSKKSK